MNSFKAVFGGLHLGPPRRFQAEANDLQDFYSVENDESRMEDVTSPDSITAEATFDDSPLARCHLDQQTQPTHLNEARLHHNQSQPSAETWVVRSRTGSRHDAAPGDHVNIDGKPEPGQLVHSGLNCPKLESFTTKGLARPTPPQSFSCPISMEVMNDPVMIATGHTYERACIEKWLSSGHQTCPLSGQRLRHSELTPNIALRNIIQDWATLHNIVLQPSVRRFGNPMLSMPSNIFTGHNEIVWALECDGDKVMSASADTCVRVWCPQQRRCTAVLEGHTRPVLSLAASHGTLFSGSYDNSVRVWDLVTSQCRAVLKGHSDAVRALAVLGEYVFSGSYDSTLRAWRLPSPHGGEISCAATLKGHSAPVRALTCLSGLVFSGSYDHTVCCWDAGALKLKGQLAGHTSSVRALATIDNLLFSGSDDSTVRCWDACTLRCTGVLKGHRDNVRVLATSSEHPHYLFSGSWDKTVHVWDVRAQTCAKVLNGHAEAVLALAVNGSQLASGSYDTTVRLWDLSRLECVQVCRGHTDAVRVLCSSCDHFISGAYDGAVGIWT
jgi:F-box and WD-40 domain protein 7